MSSATRGQRGRPTVPTLNKGIRFSLPEWGVVSGLMQAHNEDFTGVMKAALAMYANSQGIAWPVSPATSSISQAS